MVCRELGYQKGQPVTKAKFGAAESTVPIWLDHVSCDGTEKFLSDCISSGWGNYSCNHSDDAGVLCYGKKTFIEN